MSDETNDVQQRAPSYDVFISYASDDRDIARHLANELRLRGLRPWVDETELKPGVDWAEQIREGIENSRFCVILLSQKSSASKRWVSREWTSILENSWRRPEMPICSVRIEDIELPPFLREWKSVSCKRDAADVRSAADEIAILLLRGFHREGGPEKLAAEIEAQQRFSEIERAITDLAASKKEGHGE